LSIILNVSRIFARPVMRAAPDILIPEPHIAPWIKIPLRLLARPYLSLFIGAARVVLRGEHTLFDTFQRAFQNKSRCILAFLHPYGAEPQILGWFVLFKLKSLAKKAGVSFAVPPSIRFVNGYEVLRWGGRIARFVLPRIGAMPVYHAKVDSVSMERLYRALIDGPYPLALAPEGGVSYFTETVPRFEPGAVRIGFAVAERLAKMGKPCSVEILPLSIHYRFDKRGEAAMERLLRKIEAWSGLDGERGGEEMPFNGRLLQCRNRILERVETRYNIRADEAASFDTRIAALIEAAIASATALLGVPLQGGERVTRLHYLRQLCWDRLFIPGKTSLDHLSRLDRAIADLRAGEAWSASRHLEMVDFAWCLAGVAVPSIESALHERVSYVQNLWDFANRAMGGVLGTRINIHPRTVILKALPPCNLSDSLSDYRVDKKRTIQRVLSRLQAAFASGIEEVREEG
jgi:hypothetical protein